MQGLAVDHVDVAALCVEGNGTAANPWRLLEAFRQALRLLTETRKTVYFRSGCYRLPSNLEINFGDYLRNDGDVKNSPFRRGVSFVGAFAEIEIENGDSGVRFLWRGVSVFYWRFIGIRFHGRVRTDLVRFGAGNDDPDVCPWNSCEFDLVADNDWMPSSTGPPDGCPSRGLTIIRALESRLNIAAVSRYGFACLLNQAEFCQIKGTFSNSEQTAHTGTQFPGTGLYLVNCSSNNFSVVNLEVCYNGMELHGRTRGNVFNCICTTNCHPSGYVIAHVPDRKHRNTVLFLNRRAQSIPGRGVQQLFPSSINADHVRIMDQHTDGDDQQ